MFCKLNHNKIGTYKMKKDKHAIYYPKIDIFLRFMKHILSTML